MNRIVRVLIGALGLAAGVYGALLLWDQGTANLVEAGKWLVVGVVLHDAVLGPLVVVAAIVGTRLSRGRVPGAVIVGAIVLGSVTLVAVPVLGRYGARPDNPSLLPRDYAAGWWAVAALTLIAVAVAVLLGRRSAKGGDNGARPGRR